MSRESWAQLDLALAIKFEWIYITTRFCWVYVTKISCEMEQGIDANMLCYGVVGSGGICGNVML